MPQLRRHYGSFILILIIFVSLAFHLANISNSPDYETDEAEFMGVGLSLFKNQGLRLPSNFANRAEFYFAQPPLFPLLLAIVFYAFGFGIVQSRLLGVAFFMTTLLLLYFFTARFFGNRAAVITSLLLALDPFMVLYSRWVKLEPAMTFLSVASLYMFAIAEKNRKGVFYVVSGLLLGLALLTKLTAVYVYFTIAFYGAIRYIKRSQGPSADHVLYFGLTSILTFLPYVLYGLNIAPALFIETNISQISRGLGLYSQSYYYEGAFNPTTFIQSVLIPRLYIYFITCLVIVFGLTGAFSLLVQKRSDFVGSWVLSIIFFFLVHKLYEGHFFYMLMIPFFVCAGVFISDLVDGRIRIPVKFVKQSLRGNGRIYFIAVLAMLFIASYNSIVLYNRFMMMPDQCAVQAINYIKANVPANSILLCDYATGFFSDHTFYDIRSVELEGPYAVNYVRERSIDFIIIYRTRYELVDHSLVDFLRRDCTLLARFYGYTAQYMDVYKVNW